MPIVGRLDQFGSMIVTSEFNEVAGGNVRVSGLGTYYSSEFKENVGVAVTLTANVFAPYQLVDDEFAGVLFGPGQGTFMRQNTDNTVIVYNEIDEETGFGNDISFWLLGEQDSNTIPFTGSGGTFTSANITATSAGTIDLSFTFIESALDAIQNASYIRLYKNSSQIFQFTRSSGFTTTYSVSYSSGDVFYFQTELFVFPSNGQDTGEIEVTINSSLVYKYTLLALDN